MPDGPSTVAMTPNGDGETVRVAAEAFVYAYPMLLAYRALSAGPLAGEGALNAFSHDDRPAAPGHARPWGDPGVLGSDAWLDLRAEPVVLSHPELPADRYVAFQLVDLFTHNFAHVGVRSTGRRGARYAVVGPRWDGRMPRSVDGVLRAESDLVRIVGRTSVAGPEDLPTARSLQVHYRLRPLHTVAGTSAPRPAPPIDWPAWDDERAWGPDFVEYLDVLLAFTHPPHPDDRALLARFARIGIGTGPERRDPDPRTRALVARGIALGSARLHDAIQQEAPASALHGTRDALDGDHLRRAVGASVELHGPSPTEVACVRWRHLDGEPLRGHHRYRLTLRKADLPAAELGWSLAAYTEPTGTLVDNPIDRHAIGPRTPGLVWDKDGALTVTVQHEAPTDPRARANWLPVPAGAFRLIARLYAPAPPAQRGRWTPPPLRLAG